MAKLKVFISWSGERSLKVAEALRQWLPDVLQGVEPWLSAADIDKGEKWNQAVSGGLAASDYSIICLTPENLRAPWLLFEAGALSKHASSRVCTYLFALTYADVKDPLSQFQHSLADRNDTRKLIDSINKGFGEDRLDEARLQRVFDMGWLMLEKQLASISPLAAAREASDKSVAFSDDGKTAEIMSELLTRMREHSKLLTELARNRPVRRYESDLSDRDVIRLVAARLERAGIEPRRILVDRGGFWIINGVKFPDTVLKDFIFGSREARRYILQEVMKHPPLEVPVPADESDLGSISQLPIPPSQQRYDSPSRPPATDRAPSEE
jgi:hypothetical protein